MKKNAPVPTVLGSVIQSSIDYGVKAGLSRAVMLRRSGLTESALAARETRVPIRYAYALLAYLSEALNDRAIALALARSSRLDELQMLGFAMSTAANGREALDRLVASYGLVTDSGRWFYAVHEDRVEVRWQRPGPKSKGLLIGNELVLAKFVQTILAPPTCPPLRVTFMHAAPENIAPYEDFFGCPVRFGAPHDSVFFPLSFLSMRPRVGDLPIGEFLGRMTETATSQLVGTDDPFQQIQKAIRDELTDGSPDMKQVASRLGTSRRTLRRRLEQDGISFRDVVHQVRREYAEELLGRSSLSVSEVAQKLGFSEAPAFSRAFRRWTGEAPLHFRKRVSQS